MPYLLLGVGPFLWFVLLFNGGIGDDFINGAVFGSGAFMIAAGIALRYERATRFGKAFLITATLLYLPLLQFRFQGRYGVDWAALTIDMILILVMAYCFASKQKYVDGILDTNESSNRSN